MNAESDEKDGMIFLEADASHFSPRPAEGVALKSLEEHLEKIRQFAPKEYEAIMKQREAIMKQGEGRQTPQGDSSPNQGA